MPGSRENLAPGQQLYAAIEYCNSDRALFAKIDSGRYDWLGVKPDGTYVLGSPPISRSRFTASGTLTRAGSSPDNRVGIFVPSIVAPSSSHWASPDEAQTDFHATLERLAMEGEGSGIHRVVLVTNGSVTDERIVVRKVPNVL